MIINSVYSLIKESNAIGITFHNSPDGDSIGSTLALFCGLKKLNKNVYIISKEETPKYLSFLNQSEIINGKSTEVLSNTELVIVLDCGDVKRINANLDLCNRTYKVINIDHHLSNEQYGDINHVDTMASAVGEIIYELLEGLGVSIDKPIAEQLYTSILTDTGGFRHSSTTAKTHKIAGALIETGFDFSELYRKLYENKGYNKVKLYGKVIESLDLKNGICTMSLTRKMLEDVNMDKSSDNSDVISFGTQIKESEVTMLLKEADDGTKVSLRSKNYVDVRKVAEKFDGGGHIRAAGMYLKGKNIEETKACLLIELEKEMMK